MLEMIYAADENNCIGNGLDLPWPRLGPDMKWFSQNTINKVVVMGHTTWKTLSKGLPNRINVVLSSSRVEGPDMVLSGDPYKIIKEIKKEYPGKDIVIIGGASLYEAFCLLCDKIHITTILGRYPGDTFYSCRMLMRVTHHLEHEHEIPATHVSPGMIFETWRRVIH